MDIQEAAELLGITTQELFRVAGEDPWAPNSELNHLRWSMWGDAFIPDSVREMVTSLTVGE